MLKKFKLYKKLNNETKNQISPCPISYGMSIFNKKRGFTPTPFVRMLSKKDSARSASPQKVWGFTLMEMIIYVTIVSVIFVLVVNTLLILSRSYKSIKLTNDVNNSATISLERIIREIRFSNSVNTGSSILDTNPGKLVLNTTDVSGSPQTLNFYIEDGILKLDKDTTFFGNLTRDNVEVTNLIFRHINASTSEAIKVEMELTGTEGNATKVESFYTSAVLRGSY